MDYSENYGFALPTAEDDTLADIGVISRNFETVDEVMKQNSNAVGRLDAKDTDLQSQIDALGGVDVSEFQKDLNHLQEKVNVINGDIGDWTGSDTVYQAFTKLQNKDADLQSQIDNLGSGGATNLLNGSATGSLRGINTKEEGNGYTMGEEAVAEGYRTTASGSASHSEGGGTTASGAYSHSEGLYTTASGTYSHSEGEFSTASGEASHAQGGETTASGQGAHSEGWYTIAAGEYQHVQGKYNVEDVSNKYAHIVGNGSSEENRSNAHTLDWSGNAWFANDVLVGGTSQDDASAVSLTSVATMTTGLQSQITAEIANRQSADTNLQSQINAKATREVAIVGSDEADSAGWYKVADGTMPTLEDVSMLFAVHSTVSGKQYAGILQLNLRSDSSGNITCPQFGWLLRNGFDAGQVIITTDGLNWAMYFNVTVKQYYRTFFEVLQKSSRKNLAPTNYNLYTNSTVETTAPTATFTSTDLGIVYQLIADLTARIEALENSASGGTITRTLLIDWDVNTNGSTQGTVSKDADGLHASGSTSMRIANYWSNNVSAYDGITFTAYGSGKLRVEVGGVEGSYVVLSTTPTTFTFDFAENGLTDLSSVEINLQTQGAYDLTVSDIYGYTKS